MKQIDDLLTQRRRGGLSEADERRLRTVVEGSREHRLSLLAGEAFERAGAPQPGDDALVRQIVRQVEGEWSGTFQRVVSRRSRFSRWVSIPLLIVGAAAASVGGYQSIGRRPQVSPAQVAPVAGIAPLQQSPVAAAPAPAPEPIAAIERVVEAAPTAARAVPASRVDTLEPRARPSRSAAAHVPAVASAARGTEPVSGLVEAPAPVVAEAPAPNETESARELFRRATRLRQTDWEAAAVLYEQLTLRYSESAEAGVAEMALGKHALSEGHAEQALRWFRAYQLRPAGELGAEALWGQARALESLGETSSARELWRQLKEQYPGSAYAAAAREQLGP